MKRCWSSLYSQECLSGAGMSPAHFQEGVGMRVGTKALALGIVAGIALLIDPFASQAAQANRPCTLKNVCEEVGPLQSDPKLYLRYRYDQTDTLTSDLQKRLNDLDTLVSKLQTRVNQLDTEVSQLKKQLAEHHH